MGITPAADRCVSTVRSLVNGVARDAHGNLMRYVPFNGHGYIVDTNILIYMEKFLRGEAPASIARAYSRMKHLLRTTSRHDGKADIWAPDEVINEFTADPTSKFPAGTHRLPPPTSRKTPQYNSVLNELRRLSVGNTADSNDANLIADILMSNSPRSPVFVTNDKGIFFRLCNAVPTCEKSVSKGTFYRDQVNGFDYSITDSSGRLRTIRIIPIEP